MPRTDGLDISRHQGRIAWSLVPDMRLGTTKLTDGISYPQPYVDVGAQNLEAMRGLGWRWVGAYHWLRGSSSAREQAGYFWRTLRDSCGGLGPHELVQLDWEVTTNVPLATSDIAIEWADRIEEAVGRQCVITYSSDWLPDSTLDADSRREFDEWRQARPDAPLWFANYDLGSGPTGGRAECAKYDAAVWQWTGSGRIPGISTAVDLNEVCAPDVLDRLCGYAAPTQEDEVPRKVIQCGPHIYVTDGMTKVWLVDNRAVDVQRLEGASFTPAGHPLGEGKPWPVEKPFMAGYGPVVGPKAVGTNAWGTPA